VPEADVAVVGAGVNGVVAAWLLSRAGLRVAVVDPNSLPGGLAGGRVSHGLEGGRYAYALGLVPEPVWRLLGVDPRRVLHLPDPSWVELGPDGEPRVRWWSTRSWLRRELVEKGLEGLWRVVADAERFMQCLAEAGMYYTPLPPGRDEAATGLPRGCPAYFAEKAARSVLAEAAPRWAWDLVIYPSMLDANAFSLAYYLQNLNVWAQPPTGSMMWLSRLLRRLLREAGALLIQDRVVGVLREGGRAAGVALHSGAKVRARAVLYAAPLPSLPRLDGLDGVPEHDLHTLEALAARKTMVTRVDYVVKAAPRPPREPGWRGWPIYVHWTRRGGGEYTYPSLVAGKAGPPHLVQASGWPRGAPPGVDPEAVLREDRRGPETQERCCMNPTGHPDHIPMVDPHLYDQRPLPGWGDYTTPIPGLYHGSASSYPGGEVNMVAGLNAALRILDDHRHPEPWSLLGPLASYARRGLERARRPKP
jgi:phytoene dehydrogenase-like protein